MKREIPDIAIDLIKSFESLQLKAYICPAGKLTIGYGHTGPDVHPGMTVTALKANALLSADLQHTAEGVDRLVTAPIRANQFGALVSFAFNCGLGAIESSTLLKLVNELAFKEAADAFLSWDKAHENGQIVEVAGLKTRREAERALFLT